MKRIQTNSEPEILQTIRTEQRFHAVICIEVTGYKCLQLLTYL